ncbi:MULTISPECIES: hypothetical protein [unclassified Dysgonomonas]|uniref:Ig-like domain-containing protein n=1 Tax=unclassified Dysgonomonas TaxID=2630389 RepID=UPI0025BD7B50|nr:MULTISPECIES: hypothetical protein [unclassified Dysgonomonas]HMM01971.1 hypothetical protein [Dysgonomonas sp.]
MNIKRTLQLLTITGALCLTTSQLHGQVTIGAGLEPVKGALLDLKEKDSNGDVTATKGLNLPRVNLTVLTKLTGGPSGSPVITDVTDAEPDKSTHIGLTVYNVGYCPGVYVWTGTEWIKLGEPCAPVSPPSAPVNGSFCGPSGTANLSVTAGTDETADWYANATGGSPLPNGTGTTTFTTPTVSSTTIYYAETRNTITGAKSPTRTPVTATLVAPATLIRDTGKGNASQTIIAGNSITPIVYTYGGGATGVMVTGLMPANYTIDATANTVTIYGQIASTTIYMVTATAISPCSDVQMSGVLDHLPAPPKLFGDADFCGPSGTANLSVTVGPGETADWYANPAGGSPLANGTTTFTTPTINATTTYYAEARNTTTNIRSATRTAVTATLLAPATLIRDTGKGDASQTIALGSSITPIVYTYGGSATGATVTGLTPANYTINTTAKTVTINGQIASTTGYTVIATATSPCSNVRTSGTITVNNLPAAPKSGADVDFCGPSGTANLSVTVGPGETADWYANATGGSPLANGTGKTTFTTPTINATTTYYAEARNTTTNITSPTRTAVTAKIKSAADFSVSISTNSEVVVYTTGQDNDISNDKFVANTIPTLSVTGTGTGLTYKWQSKKLEDAGYRDINGATSASYTPGSPGTGQAAYNYLGLYQYRCIVRDASGCEATTANIEVAWGCGAKTTSGAWLKFMCHNLGADENLDPFTWKSNGDNVGNDIKGDLYQWGRRKDGHQLRASGTTSTLATTNTPNHAFYITSTSTPYDWRSGGENVTRWGDGTQNSIMPKAANDPCPAGWKVPSMGQWNSVSGIYSGTEIRDNASRFQNGYTIAPSLYLPAAGGRDTRGTLSVDSTGRYWTSTISQPSTINIHNRYDICSYGMTFGHLNPENFSITPYSNMDRSQGRSVRCIAE